MFITFFLSHPLSHLTFLRNSQQCLTLSLLESLFHLTTVASRMWFSGLLFGDQLKNQRLQPIFPLHDCHCFAIEGAHFILLKPLSNLPIIGSDRSGYLICWVK